MFIFDFLVGSILDQVLDWLYGCIVSFFCDLFALMNGMGTELFELHYVQALILFFAKLGWALYVVGIVVALFETAILYQIGRANVYDVTMNVIKGFFAVNLFHLLPIALYEAAVRWQMMLGKGISGLSGVTEIGTSALELMTRLTGLNPGGTGPLLGLFFAIAIGYSVIKVFFANITRGGILVIQIAVGSLYMFSIPRGYLEGFKQWVKQVIGICLTTFLQSLVLVIGLRVFLDHPVLGTGLMLSSTEVPRICGQFGVDTSAKTNVMGGVYAVQTAIHVGTTIAKAAA
jgi:hypothetical protein